MRPRFVETALKEQCLGDLQLLSGWFSKGVKWGRALVSFDVAEPRRELGNPRGYRIQPLEKRNLLELACLY